MEFTKELQDSISEALKGFIGDEITPNTLEKLKNITYDLISINENQFEIEMLPGIEPDRIIARITYEK